MDTRRRFMMGEKGGRLPSGYTAVDWIQSDGTAYILTGLTTKEELALEVDMLFPNSKSTAIILGGGGTSLAHRMVSIRGGASNRVVYINYNRSTGVPCVSSDGVTRNVYLAKVKDGSQIITRSKDGAVLQTDTGITAATDLETGYNIIIGNNALPKIYGCAIYSDFDATIKTFEGIPCQQDSDGQYGVFDTISKQFLGNAAGSGAFTGGYD